MSRVSENLVNATIVSITDSTTGASTGDIVNDTTASVKDDIACLARKINEIIVALRTAGVFKS